VVNATPRPHYPRERDPVPTVQEREWALGTFWTDAENLATTCIRFPDRPAHSELLCQLRYYGYAEIFRLYVVSNPDSYALQPAIYVKRMYLKMVQHSP
jgi:hypothetical protein